MKMQVPQQEHPIETLATIFMASLLSNPAIQETTITPDALVKEAYTYAKAFYFYEWKNHEQTRI
jgi:hypothetical protein